ncbi:MAG: SsrA-binding protein SmpB [Synergistales bacterium]|nr:SsrA-binding protein SmpB [Synergistales bacterium]MDY6402016.1 SsrA-binding protein SmpB [Synergistales bacterium]MDY6404209.1 SsrA-binding protein SmpB [Synergistales bacterium]MDY6411145.1 SsrA-binding protein SmpB [Synergistales bacterium]MDY6413948.1 SsrA-binding protein SmpB [Synergistales bacterium]
MSKFNTNNKVVAQNRKARHDYFILEAFECGIVLTGTEIKSVRAGSLNLKDSYASLKNDELWLFGVHISPYDKGTYYNHEPERDRKLLMHKREIIRLKNKIREKGLTLVPLTVYIKNGKRAKVELALAKGRNVHDKRDAIADRDMKRTIARAFRDSRDY